ncbi:hypothetical protein RclHR1_27600001 [Rhizophagus clarus]|uniref:C2H2-type domain-containing protein n=1 Tax=Rhizophagus clarus TaxID=94130 RepID=A0A2Z6RWR3_9GLOM|nr:hypothetical protein RclHR1_27600001 [Rhizophagus clarus]
MGRKTRSDKKDTTCKRCGKVCVNPNKLREHLRRKNPCKPKTDTPIQAPVQEVNQEVNQQPVQEAIQEPLQIPTREVNQNPVQEAIQDSSKDIPFKNPNIEWNYQDIKRKLGTYKNLQQETCCRPEEFDRKRFYLEMKKECDLPYTGITTSKWSSFLYSAIQYLRRGFDRERGGYIDAKGVVAEIRKEIFPERLTTSDTELSNQAPKIPEKAVRFINPNNRKPGEHFRKWGARLLKRWKELELGDRDRPENLHECNLLNHDLEQLDPEASRPPTKEEYEEYCRQEKANNEEFKRLGGITEEQERDIEFREQEELGTALKKRAIAVHRAKVPQSHPDNGSDIRKMLESRRRQFKEILEKEFDKRGQFNRKKEFTN